MTLPKKPHKGKYYNPKKILTTKRDLRLTEKYLERLFVEENTKSTQTLQEECSICYCEIDTIKNISVTSCNHTFCFTCITRWTRSHDTCPVCRFNFFQSDLQENDQSLTDRALSSNDISTIGHIQAMAREALAREQVAREVANSVIENALEQLNERQNSRRRLIFDDL